MTSSELGFHMSFDIQKPEITIPMIGCHDIHSCFANVKDIISASQHRLDFWWPQIPVLPSSLTSPHKYKVSNSLGFERIWTPFWAFPIFFGTPNISMRIPSSERTPRITCGPQNDLYRSLAATWMVSTLLWTTWPSTPRRSLGSGSCGTSFQLCIGRIFEDGVTELSDVVSHIYI